MRKPWVKIVALLFLAALAWFSYIAVRAHRNLVTLDVHNASLRDVIKKIEWQTWEVILVPSDVDGKVTLRVDSVPLEEVLTIVAEQTSSRWTALYPLYTSGHSLANFKKSARGEIVAAENGWTNLKPRPSFGLAMRCASTSRHCKLLCCTTR